MQAFIPFLVFFSVMLGCALLFVGVTVHDTITHKDCDDSTVHYWDHSSFFNVKEK